MIIKPIKAFPKSCPDFVTDISFLTKPSLCTKKHVLINWKLGIYNTLFLCSSITSANQVGVSASVDTGDAGSNANVIVKYYLNECLFDRMFCICMYV